MSVRLTKASSQELTRTTGLVDYNGRYSWMGWRFLVTDTNDFNHFFQTSNVSNPAGAVDDLGTNNDGTALANYVEPPGTNAAGNQLPIGRWFHLAQVRESATSNKSYVNGALVATNTANVGGRAAAGNMRIGSWDGTQEFSDILLFGDKIWSEALSLHEVLREIKTISPLRRHNLHSFYPFNKVSDLRDYGPNGYDPWTVAGSPTTWPSRPSIRFFLPTFRKLIVASSTSTITASSIASAEAFGTAKLNLKIATTGIASTEAFGSHSLDTAITVSGIATAEAFGTAKLNLEVAASSIGSAEVFGSATIAAGAVLIATTGIASAEAFGTAKLNLEAAASSIGSAEAFGSHTLVAGEATIVATGIASAEVFGTAKLNLEIVVSSIGSAEAFGSHTLAAGSETIVVTGIASQEAFGTTILQQGTFIAITGIGSTEVFGSHTLLAGDVTIAPTGIASTETFGTAKLNLEIVVSSIGSAEAFGGPTVEAGDVTIVVTGIASQEAFGTALVFLDNVALVTGIASQEVFGAASLEQEYVSGYTIDGENQVEINTPYGSLTLYSNGEGGFYGI